MCLTLDTMFIIFLTKDWLQKLLIQREQCLSNGLVSCTPTSRLKHCLLEKNCIVQKFQMDELQRHWPRQRELEFAIAFRTS